MCSGHDKIICLLRRPAFETYASAAPQDGHHKGNKQAPNPEWLPIDEVDESFMEGLLLVQAGRLLVHT